MSDYDYDAATAVGMLVVLLVVFFLAIAMWVVTSFFMMKIFDKAGVQGRWRAWVPIYNTMVFSKLGDLSPWLVLIAIGASLVLSWVPVLGWVISIASALVLALAAWRVGLKLQKEPIWVILYVFLSPIWLGINAFDRSRWNTAVPPAPWAQNSFLADSTQWAGVPSQAAAGGYPPAGYQPPAPPAGYVPPAPPAGYTPPPAGYTPPAPPAGYAPPAAP
ncbi:large exoprotein, partial [Microbacterium sp.]|uniref:large exoprotein n=1 Tax=Microbacterium sp. TaxID=51671 RepID=UPI0039E26031